MLFSTNNLVRTFKSTLIMDALRKLFKTNFGSNVVNPALGKMAEVGNIEISTLIMTAESICYYSEINLVLNEPI